MTFIAFLDSFMTVTLISDKNKSFEDVVFGSSASRYLACPMCEASYTVGPQQYHVTRFPL